MGKIRQAMKDAKRLGGGKDLIDTTFVALTLLESKEGEPERCIVRGEFSPIGRPTDNRRVYPRPIWESNIAKLSADIAEGKVFGEADHPQDGRTKLQRVSHIIRKLEIEGDSVMGEAEILDTDQGKNLKAIVRAGGKIGVSSRGFGSTKRNAQGFDEVQEDYNLVTWDFVAEPASKTSYPDVFTEEREMKLQEFKESNPEALAALKVEVLAEMRADDTVRREIAESLRPKIEEGIRASLMEDPDVGGAKTAIGRVTAALRPFLLSEEQEQYLREKESELRNLSEEKSALEEENKKLAAVAKRAGYELFIERNLANDPDAKAIKTLVGDVGQYASGDELKAKLQQVSEALGERRAESEKRQKIEEEAAAEKKKLTEALANTADSLTKVSLVLYAERKLRGNPRATRIVDIIESQAPTSREAVDKIIESYERDRQPSNGGSDVEAIHSRVRALVGNGNGNPPREGGDAKPAQDLRESRGSRDNGGKLQSEERSFIGDPDEFNKLARSGQKPAAAN